MWLNILDIGYYMYAGNDVNMHDLLWVYYYVIER